MRPGAMVRWKTEGPDGSIRKYNWCDLFVLDFVILLVIAITTQLVRNVFIVLCHTVICIFILEFT